MDRRTSRWAALALAGLVLAASSGCFGVRGRRAAPPPSGFLGDYSQLERRPEYQAHLVYVRPDVDWSRYGSIEIDSVTLWVTEETAKLDEETQQRLTDTLYKSLYDALAQQFEIVEHPRSDTLRIRAALTQARGANVPLRAMSTYVPVGLVLTTAVGNAADVTRNVGTAAIEVEVVDPVTDRRLAAAVDSRAGTKNPFTQRTFTTWGDVDAAFDWWAGRGAEFLVRVGVRTK